MPARLSKRSRDSPEGPPEELIADRFHNECIDFARSQGKAKLYIAASHSSDKTFGYLLWKIKEAAKCLLNRHSKLSAADVRVTSVERAANATAVKAAADAQPVPSPTATEMVELTSLDSASITSDALTEKVADALCVANTSANISPPELILTRGHEVTRREDDGDDPITSSAIEVAISAADMATQRLTRLSR